MFLVDLLQWWYRKGWGVFREGFATKLKDTSDMFSIGELLRTLFRPYKQISANAENSQGESRVNVFFDKLISRLVGAVTRTVLIFAGIIALVVETVVGIVMIVLWPVMPVLPVIGIVLAVMGVTL